MIAVFSKYEQFKRNVRMKLQDTGAENSRCQVESEVERIFQTEYLTGIGGTSKYVQLESECKVFQDLSPTDYCFWRDA